MSRLKVYYVQKKMRIIMKLETKRAQVAYDLSSISKPTISGELFDELLSDFEKRHAGVTIEKKVRNPDPYGWNVIISSDNETMELYEEWRDTFTVHGYQPPFLTVHCNNDET